MESLIEKKELIPTVVFGDGSIRLNTGFFDDLDENKSFISFTKQEPQEIGRMENYCDPFELKDAGLVFIFTNSASIDAIIDSLEDAKKQLKVLEE